MHSYQSVLNYLREKDKDFHNNLETKWRKKKVILCTLQS